MVNVAGLGGNVISIVVQAVDNFSTVLDTAKKDIKGLGGFIEQNSKTIRNASLGLTAFGTAGAIGIKSIVDEAGTGIGVMNAFNNMFGDEATSALDELRVATRGTVSDIELMTNANQAMLLGIDPKALPAMFKGALAASQATGRPVSSAIADITTGIGRQSRMILDNLGIIVNAEAANEAYAMSLGITSAELDENQKKAAFTAATMTALEENMTKVGEVTDSVALKTQRANAAWDNAKQTLGEALAPAMVFLAETISGLVGWFNELNPSTQQFIAILGGSLVVLSLVAGAIGLVTVAMSALAVVSLPVLAIVVAIVAAVAAVIAIMQNWDKIMTFFNARLADAGKGLELWKNAALLAWETVKLGLATAVNFMIKSIFTLVNEFIKGINIIIKAANLAPGISIPLVPKIDTRNFLLDTKAMEDRVSSLKNETTSLFNELKDNNFLMNALNNVEGTASTSTQNNVSVQIEQVNGTDPDAIAEALQEQLGDLLKNTTG